MSSEHTGFSWTVLCLLLNLFMFITQSDKIIMKTRFISTKNSMQFYKYLLSNTDPSVKQPIFVKFLLLVMSPKISKRDGNISPVVVEWVASYDTYWLERI